MKIESWPFLFIVEKDSLRGENASFRKVICCSKHKKQTQGVCIAIKFLFIDTL